MNDNRLLLTLPVEPLVGLLVLLQAPGQAKPDDDVASVLEIQAVCDAGRVNQENWDLPGVPVLDVL